MFRERRASPSLPAARFFDERRVLLAECIQSRPNEWVGEDTACASFAGTSRPRAVSIISIGSILGAPGPALANSSGSDAGSGASDQGSRDRERGGWGKGEE